MSKSQVIVINSSTRSISIGEGKGITLESGKHAYSLTKSSVEQLLAASNEIAEIEVQLIPTSEASTVDGGAGGKIQAELETVKLELKESLEINSQLQADLEANKALLATLEANNGKLTAEIEKLKSTAKPVAKTTATEKTTKSQPKG